MNRQAWQVWLSFGSTHYSNDRLMRRLGPCVIRYSQKACLTLRSSNQLLPLQDEMVVNIWCAAACYSGLVCIHCLLIEFYKFRFLITVDASRWMKLRWCDGRMWSIISSTMDVWQHVGTIYRRSVEETMLLHFAVELTRCGLQLPFSPSMYVFNPSIYEISEVIL